MKNLVKILSFIISILFLYLVIVEGWDNWTWGLVIFPLVGICFNTNVIIVNNLFKTLLTFVLALGVVYAVFVIVSIFHTVV